MLKKKDIIVIIISIVLMLSAIIILLSFNSGMNKKTKDTSTKDTQTEPKLTDKEESLILLNKLINSEEYKTLNNEDKTFYNKYKSLEFIIYNDNVYSYKDLSNDEILASIFNNIDESNIKDIERKDNDLYGSVKKTFINNKIKSLYNTNKIKVKVGNNINKYNYNFITISNKVYRYVYLVEKDEKNYKIRIVDNYGTYVSPRTYPFPMKIVSVKEIDDYLLITTKAVIIGEYSTKDENNFKDGNWILPVCDYYENTTTCHKELGTTTAPQGPFTTIDIDEYLEEANTIYTIFKKEKDEYYFYKNFINNE